MAWLEKRHGIYEIVYYTRARKRTRQSCKTSSLRKAKYLLAKFQANEETDRALIPREKSIRFYDHLDRYLKWVRQNRSDAWANKQRMYAEANFKPFFGNMTIWACCTNTCSVRIMNCFLIFLINIIFHFMT